MTTSTLRTVLLFAIAGLLLAASAYPADEPAEAAPARGPRAGRLLRVSTPITTSVINHVLVEAKAFIAAAKKQNKWPVVIFEIEPGESDFEPAHALARRIILELDAATTVAYLANDADGKPRALRGHGVLVALACEQIALHPDAAFGEVYRPAGQGGPPRFLQTMVTAYREIAKTRNTVSPDLAEAMLDPSLEIWEIQRLDQRREFVRRERMEEIDKKVTLAKRQKWIEPGKTALIRGEDAASMGLVDRDHLVNSRNELAAALQLPPEALEDDAFWSTTRRAMVFPLAGMLDANDVRSIEAKIRKHVKEDKINLIILEIDSPGGAPGASSDLAKYLANSLRPNQQRTVAHILNEAGGDAVDIALACDHIVMGPAATLGGAFLDDQRIDLFATGLQERAEKKGRSRSLARALIDPTTRVFRYTRREDGLVAFFTEAEHATQPDPERWQQGLEITQPGKALALSADRAVEYRMATAIIQNHEELKDRYRLTYDPPRAESDWLDVLLAALQNKFVLSGLLMIGLVSFYAEMHSPGTGVGGFIAVCCFLLYFWANFLGGSADWLEILLFVVGLLLILIEIFVIPGFGIIGLGGGVMMLAAIVMAMHTFRGLPNSAKDMIELRDSLTVFTLAAIGAIVGGAMLRRFLPSTPGLSELILQPPDAIEYEQQQVREAPARYDHLLGERGVALTQLTPSGKARFGNELLDVVTEGGDLIQRGDEVVVVAALGNRVVVRSA